MLEGWTLLISDSASILQQSVCQTLADRRITARSAVDRLQPDDPFRGLLGAPARAALAFEVPPGIAVGLDRPLDDAHAFALPESGNPARGGARLTAGAQWGALGISDLRRAANAQRKWRGRGNAGSGGEDRGAHGRG